MKVKSYKVTEVSGKITVEIQVKETQDRNPTTDRKAYNAKDVKQFLVKEGYKNIGNVLTGSKITNFQGPKAATGTWTFSIVNQSVKENPKKVVKAVAVEEATVTPTVTPVQNAATKKQTTKKKSSVK
jgi:virulence-associated protein VapD